MKPHFKSKKDIVWHDCEPLPENEECEEPEMAFKCKATIKTVRIFGQCKCQVVEGN